MKFSWRGGRAGRGRWKWGGVGFVGGVRYGPL